MDRVDGAAGQAADDRSVDPDVLEIVACVLLDEPHRAIRPEGVDASLDERGHAVLVPLDDCHRLPFQPAVQSAPELRIGGDGPASALELGADPRDDLR
jgi:hypothetical protein